MFRGLNEIMYVVHLAQSDLSKNKNIPRTSLFSAKLSSPGEGGERGWHFFLLNVGSERLGPKGQCSLW